MDAQQLLEVMRVGETGDLECKSAKGGFPGSFWETYSAMANTNGGVVILGAKEKDHRVEPDGLTQDQINSHQKKLWDDLHNRSKVSKNLLASSDVQVQSVDGKNLLVITIPRANRTDIPIYLGPTPLGNTYRRCSEGDYRCTDEQVRRMLADASPIPRDHRILSGFGINDLDPLSLDQYKRRFSASKPNHPWDSLPVEQFLEMLGGWRKDRESGETGITLASVLMFGRHRSIMDAAPDYFVDYREKLDPDIRWNHRIYPDGTWEPNLFQFYQKIWPHLSSDLKVPFQLEGIQRIDETSVHKALREALVNALVHSDYASPGGIVIERYRDRFILDNPGSPLVSLEQLRRGGISECRNKSLQTMFIMIGGGERAGSGINHIQNEWKNQHWRAPAFSIENDRFKLVLPMVSLIPDATFSSLEKRFGQKFRSLKQLEVIALATADIEGEVSNARLQELSINHPAEITQILQGLCLKGMLTSDNRRRWSCYRIGNSPHLTGNSPHLAEDSPHLTGNSPHLDIQDLEMLAFPVAHSKKTSKSTVRATIIQLCKSRHLSLNELARFLKRSPKSLQNHYLTQLVAEGILELQYPEAPNRPDQAYIIKDEKMLHPL